MKRKNNLTFGILVLSIVRCLPYLCCLYFFLPAAEHKCLKRGVKEVVKSIRRGQKG